MQAQMHAQATQQLAELEARKPLPPTDMTPVQHVNALVGDGLTAQKVEAICEREPYDVTGVVLSLPDGRACIVNLSAVRWFSGAGDFRALMHGDPVAEERAACAKLCMDKAHKMEREAVDAEKEGDGTTRDDNRATAWVLAVCSQEILARGKPA
ncbi:MAG: hypothetical protein DI604_34690 [Delftia acidovorans]|nr:MAG: hypothetical protein DI604_34690 [Delftia acidovorans]